MLRPGSLPPQRGQSSAREMAQTARSATLVASARAAKETFLILILIIILILKTLLLPRGLRLRARVIRRYRQIIDPRALFLRRKREEARAAVRIRGLVV